jgi:hypothetical protein
MRRDLEWKTKRDGGTFYEVRVSFFGAKYKFQYRESADPLWDYNRVPSREDLEMLLTLVQRRYQRRRGATEREVNEAKRLIAEANRAETS